MRASTLDEQVSDQIIEGISAAANGQFEQAFKAIASIDVVGLRQQRERLRAQFRNILPNIDSKQTDDEISMKDTSIWANKAYFCRYCGKRTIDVRILKLFSSAFPGILPWERNWKYAHVIYWTHSASIEHHLPLNRGGDDSSDNRIRTCYQCNDIKNNRLISELGWSIYEPDMVTQQWDGLVGYFSRLEQALSDVHKEQVLPKWMRSQVAHLTLNPLAKTGPLLVSPSQTVGASPRAVITSKILLASDIREGYFIRTQLPGKKSKRSYRVLSIQGEQIVLNEMWQNKKQNESKGIWNASDNHIVLSLKELEQVEMVIKDSPMPGQR